MNRVVESFYAAKGFFKNIVMAKNIKVNELVSVPRNRLGLDIGAQSAIYTGKVVEVNGRSIKVDMPYGEVSEWIPTSAVQKNVKVMIIQVGDFDTEYTLLEPLRKSVLQYFRLLLNDEEVISHSVRSLDELSIIWKRGGMPISHVILIGHGRRNGIKFGDTWVSPYELNDAMIVNEIESKQFISLCCETGFADFGKTFSGLPVAESFIAPFHSVHGSIASQFCQTYFAHHLLLGQTSGVAFKKARDFTPSATSFRLWKNKKLIAGQKS